MNQTNYRFFRFLVEAPWVKESAVLVYFQQEVNDISIPIPIKIIDGLGRVCL